MNANAGKKTRPYWHVDAKWLTGILLLFLLNITFLVFILVQVTAPEQGITLLTTSLASSFSFESGGLDAAGEMEIIRQMIAESPDGEWQPIPGLQTVVRLEDIEGKTPREVRLWFFRQMAEPLYYGGVQGLADIMTDPDMQETLLEGGVGPLGFISAETHSRLLMIFAASGLVSLLFLGLLVLFSYRFGRLGSPGCVIFLAAIPGLLFFGGLRGWLNQMVQNPPPFAEQTVLARYAQLAADILPGTIQTSLYVYGILILLGLLLMSIALVGMIFIRERKAREPSA